MHIQMDLVHKMLYLNVDKSDIAVCDNGDLT